MHGRLVEAVGPLLRAPEVAAGDDRHLADQVEDRLRRGGPAGRTVLDAGQHLGAGRLLAAGRLQQGLPRRRRPLLHQLQFQLRGGLDDRLGPVDVGHARQLHQQVVLLRTLLRDERLGHAQLVHAALDRLLRLLDRRDGQVAGDVRLHRERVAAGARLAVVRRLERDPGLTDRGVLRRRDPGHLELRRAGDVDGHPGHASRLERLPEPFAGRGGLELQGLVGVHAQHEVDAALEVESQPDLLARRDDRPQAGADDDDDEDDAPAKVVHAWVVSGATGSWPWRPAIAPLEISMFTLSAICSFTDRSAIFWMVP